MAKRDARTLEELRAEATSRIERLEPLEAFESVEAGALLVDIRADADRERDGVVPGALHIPRTVLEWRFAGEPAWRNPHVGPRGRQVLLLCDHGCSSILAAANLVELGFERTGDVIGGYEAWRAAGLPTSPATPSRREPGEPAGMRPPD